MTKKALVTGASGFFASQLVRHLTEAGYEVRGTVRSLLDRTKVNHLQEQFPALRLFQAELLEAGSFDEAVKGVDVVFHTASPFTLTVQNPQRDLVDPAVQGTLNVLRSVDKAGSVKRVVLTSSVASIARGKPDSYAYSEADWNTESSVMKEPYAYSKKAAEEEAWKFAKGKKWDLVAICPSFIIGPPLSKRVDATSIQAVKRLLEGAHQETAAGPALGMVSVNDVCRAHVLAAERKEAGGQRYMLTSSKAFTRQDLCSMLINSGKFKDFPLEKNKFLPANRTFHYNNAKGVQLLGKLDGVESTVIEMASALVRLGVAKKPLQSAL